MGRVDSRREEKATGDFREQIEGLYIQPRNQQRGSMMRQMLKQGEIAPCSQLRPLKWSLQ